MKIIIASDHAGYNLKETIKEYIKTSHLQNTETDGVEFCDIGCYNKERCNFPFYANNLCTELKKDTSYDFGILICGTGIGMSIAANKNEGIRCALCHSGCEARMARQHNNANVLALGERVIGAGMAINIIDTFLTTKFLGGRYKERMSNIN